MREREREGEREREEFLEQKLLVLKNKCIYPLINDNK